MPPDSPNPITNISDTARWVAWYRAVESERRDAHFRDPFARRLAGEQGEAIVRSLPSGRRMGWAMVVRTVLLDEMITRLVEHERADAVLNLAAGLDARPWRMDLPERLQWYDVDLPGILETKRRVLADERPRCRLETRAVDLADERARLALFAEVGGAHERVVVMTEGLLIYLLPDHVAALGRDLHAQRSFRWWLMELGSPALLRYLERSWAPRLRSAKAPFRFAPREGTAFFTPLGWRETEYRSMWEESFRLRRTIPMGWFWRLLGRLAPPERQNEVRRFSGVVRLDRVDD
jgi:methyltransferase (TIGR00027 family)